MPLEVSTCAQTLLITFVGERGNALTSADIGALGDRLEATRTDDTVETIVLAGKGADFCGGRIGAAVTTAEEMADDLRLVIDVGRLLSTVPQVVIAAVEGAASGFGCGIAVQSDLTIAARDAAFGFPEIRKGIPPLLVMSYLGRYVSPKLAFDWTVTGRDLGVDDLRENGLISEVVEPGKALPTALTRAAELGSLEREGVQLLKRFARSAALTFEKDSSNRAVIELSRFLAACR